MELRPGLKDIRRPAELMYAYIVLSLLCGIRTEEARALRWSQVELDGDPEARPAVPPHVAVWWSVRTHAETKTERSRRTLGLRQPAMQALRALREIQAEERLLAGATVAGHRAGVHHPPRHRAGHGQRPEDVQARLRDSRGGGRLDAAGTADLVRELVEPPQGSHRGDRPSCRARLHPHHRDRRPQRIAAGITTGAEIMDELFGGT